MSGGAVVSFPSNPDATGMDVRVAQMDAGSVAGLTDRRAAASVLTFSESSLSKPAVAQFPHSASDGSALEVSREMHKGARFHFQFHFPSFKLELAYPSR